MHRKICVFLLGIWSIWLFSSNEVVGQNLKCSYRDIYPDTWVCNDALGRKMPVVDDAGPVKNDQRRVVGIFYVTWHSDPLAKIKTPYYKNVTEILEENPEARLDGKSSSWENGGGYYHWGEPEDGYFLSKDPYVIRKDISMLADAGVDVLIMDATNAVEYWSEWEAVFTVIQKMKSEGNKVPAFCFWAFNGPVITVVQDIYDRIYKEKKYSDLWFYWDGKPLILCNMSPEFDANSGSIKHTNHHFDKDAITNKNNPHYGDPDYTEPYYKAYTKEIKEFFTMRNMWWGYYEWGGKRFVGTEGNWSFGYDLGDERVRNLPPANLLSTYKGKKEEAAVTPAQHPMSMIGKSWSRVNGEPKLDQYDLPKPAYIPWLDTIAEHPTDYGIYFQERWDEALQGDPQFLYINDWNEWTAGKFFFGDVNFLGRKSDFMFVDQYNSEFNRTIQPMKGGYTDNYYMQMAQNIRRYKGVRSVPVQLGCQKIKLDGIFDDWNQIQNEYRDTKGDVVHRDYNGYAGLHYTNEFGRNDILTSKVSVDKNNLYFYVETADRISPYTDENWMLLFIDADQDPATGWYGYDYVLNLKVIDGKTSVLMSYDASAKENPWKEVEEISFCLKDNQMELCIPRKSIHLNKDQFTIDFKWSDHPKNLESPISFCTEGDTGPNRRFNYRFIWKKK